MNSTILDEKLLTAYLSGERVVDGLNPQRLRYVSGVEAAAWDVSLSEVVADNNRTIARLQAGDPYVLNFDGLGVPIGEWYERGKIGREEERLVWFEFKNGYVRFRDFADSMIVLWLFDAMGLPYPENGIAVADLEELMECVFGNQFRGVVRTTGFHESWVAIHRVFGEQVDK